MSFTSNTKYRDFKTRLPSVSVVLPCSDDLDRLEIALSALRLQAIHPEEIICVDDTSNNTASKYLSTLARSFGVKYLCGPFKDTRGGHRSHARNLGTAAARGDVILYVDADMLLSVEYIRTIKMIHAIDHWAMVKGTRYSIKEKDYYKWASLIHNQNSKSKLVADEYRATSNDLTPTAFMPSTPLPCIAITPSFADVVDRRGFLKSLVGFILIGIGGKANIPFSLDYSTRWDYCASNNLSIRRTHAQAVHGWDESFSGWGEEDMDFAYRLMMHGCRPILPESQPVFAYHLDHDISHEKNHASMRKNAIYFVKKFPEMKVIREDVYHHYNLNLYEDY